MVPQLLSQPGTLVCLNCATLHKLVRVLGKKKKCIFWKTRLSPDRLWDGQSFIRFPRVLSRYPLAWSFCAWLLGVADAVELTEMFGEIRSPNFPDSYPSDSEVTWNISVPEGFKIKLYFMHFDLESSYLCEYDYVKVSGGIRGRMNGQVGHAFGQQGEGSAGKAGNEVFFPIYWAQELSVQWTTGRAQ